MYGLVNRAIEGMVCDSYGPATWETIKTRAGVDVPVFVSNESYPDEVTYQLVGAASEVLQSPAEEILKAFGEYWVLNTALKAYGPLMHTGGRTLKDFLMYLPHFHVRVQAIFPKLAPPEFSCENVGDDSLDLHYKTGRPAGLEPFVEGLVRGLAKMFETPVDVKMIHQRGIDSDHSVFHVRWGIAG